MASTFFGAGTCTHTQEDGGVTCVSISSLVVDAYNILVKKKFYKFYVLSVGASTAKNKGKSECYSLQKGKYFG